MASVPTYSGIVLLSSDSDFAPPFLSPTFLPVYILSYHYEVQNAKQKNLPYFSKPAQIPTAWKYAQSGNKASFKQS